MSHSNLIYQSSARRSVLKEWKLFFNYQCNVCVCVMWRRWSVLIIIDVGLLGYFGVFYHSHVKNLNFFTFHHTHKTHTRWHQQSSIWLCYQKQSSFSSKCLCWDVPTVKQSFCSSRCLAQRHMWEKGLCECDRYETMTGGHTADFISNIS